MFWKKIMTLKPGGGEVRQPGWQTRNFSMQALYGGAELYTTKPVDHAPVLQDRGNLRARYKTGQHPATLPSYYKRVKGLLPRGRYK